jgi:hypothetical protein
LARDGFSQERVYRVKLNVDTDGSPIETDYCGSRELANAAGSCEFYSETPGKGLGSGDRTAIQKEGSLTVRWGAADDEGPRRVAGTYQDFITVVVGVKV